MEKPIRTFLQTTFILFTLVISVQAQPALITEVPNGSENFVTIGELAYFTSGDSLLRTDGTAAGTIFLKSGFEPFGRFTEFKGSLFFTASPDPANENSPLKELWRSDGTPSGTILLKTSSEYDLQILYGAGDFLYFRASDLQTGHELYKTNGTAAGTMVVKDIKPGPDDGFSGNAAAVGNSLFFAADDGTHGAELWKSDGSSGGTVMIKDINPGASDGFGTGPANFPFTVFAYNNQLYFTGITPENGQEPWVSDGSAAGTTILRDIVPGPESRGRIQHTIGHNGVLYFIVFPATLVFESSPRDLWKTAGTMASTVKVKTLSVDDTEHSYHSFLIYKDKVHFFNHANSYEDILWVTDGTATGTFSFFSFETMEGGVNYFDEVNDYLLFTGSAQALPTPLFRSDGTNQGTQEIATFKSSGYRGGGRSVTQVDLTTVNDYAFYADHTGPDRFGPPDTEEDYFHLFQTDGVTTQSIRTIYGVNTIGTDNITNFHGKVLFTTRNDQDGSTDTQKRLWIYDPANPPEPEACAGAGKIIREVWSGIPGKEVSSIPVNSPPTSTSELTIFEGPFRVADNYGARIRGYVCVPATGNYTFWIASDDRSELWLSTDDNPANKVKIASVGGATSRRQWDKYTSQKSSPVPLIAGRKYYIEALHKESVTYDHVAVGWQLPNGTMERPIPGNRLIPFSSPPSVNITSPEDGQNFAAPATVNIAANASSDEGSIAKVEFYNGTTKLGEDATSPYAFTWNNVSGGDYTLIAKAINTAGISGTDSVDITVTSSCAGTGTIVREVWSGIPGKEVSLIPVNSPPSSTSVLTLFEGPFRVADNYGARIRGYICVPATGNYTFWIASDDRSELWLSTSDNPDGKARIAHVGGATSSRQWDKYTSQRSVPISLTAGQRYYIEALHKESVTYDHVAVGWQLPDGTMERPIPGNRLMRFESATTSSFLASNTMASQSDSLTASTDDSRMGINIYPNPAPSGVAGLTISRYGEIQEVMDTKIEIVSMTGEVVYTDKIFCEGNCDTDVMKINKELVSGIYLVNVITNGRRFSKRLLVK